LLKQIKRNLFISVGVGAIIYLALTIYADSDSVITSFNEFNWLLLPLLLLLSLFNYVTRFFKWDYYLRLLQIKITKKDSFTIFMSGLIMSVTPGKMGELLKSYMVKQISEEPISKTAPIVFAERLTDFLSLIILAMVGAFVFNYGKTFVIILLILFLCIILLLSNKNSAILVIALFNKIPLIKKFTANIRNAFESSFILFRLVPLIFMVFLSSVSWFFECFGFYIILLNFNINFSLLLSTFIYAFSTIAGAVSMLPGGLGVTEGSLTLLIVEQNITLDIAIASTFIVRVVTLWFAVLVGIISLLLYQNRFGKIKVD